MTNTKKPNRTNKPINTTMDDVLSGKLKRIAGANQMTFSALLRWVGARVAINPEAFGLLPVDKKDAL